MHSFVQNEVSPLSEGLPAITALIWLFPGMNSFVLNEGTALSEGLPTIAALIGLFTSMNSLVSNEVNFVAEAFPTITALITLFYSRNAPRCDEEVSAVKARPTGTVHIRFFSRGNPSVLRELPALATRVMPFSRTDPLPLDKVLIVESSLLTFTQRMLTFSTGSGLPTLPATVWPLSGKSGLELQKV